MWPLAIKPLRLHELKFRRYGIHPPVFDCAADSHKASPVYTCAADGYIQSNAPALPSGNGREAGREGSGDGDY
ncbi:predicted protein [Botrytis cinerea T4]|uniref:Uncharacterized protein n=1 Tax=Botryotinia fuckeliana (strain T4) TaxID=999810 RepID=G2XXJ9_BOTF4|nr:predicted protein [Botrytis cinerea T4]